MKRLSIYVFLICSIFVLAAPVVAAGPGDKNDSLSTATFNIQKHQAEQAMQAAKQGPPVGPPPRNNLIGYARAVYIHSDAVNNLGPHDNYKSGSAHGKGTSIGFLATSRVSSWFSVGALFEYFYFDYRGGIMEPKDEGALSFSSDSHTQLDSYMAGIMATFHPKDYGRLTLGLVFALDYFDGWEAMYTNVNGTRVATDKRNQRLKDKVAALSASYEIDIPLTEALKFTPYIGYHPTYIYASKYNDWRPGGTTWNVGDWWHYGTAGAKLSYQEGLFSGTLKLGVSHLLQGNTVDGLTVRPMGSGGTMPGMRAGADDTVASAGLAAGYVFPEVGVLSLDYQGMYGSNTQGHNLTLSLVIPF